MLRRLMPGGKAAPWAVPRPLAENIVRDMRAENEGLSRWLTESDRERMRADTRWWAADAYAHHWSQ
ncbi:hypothetical protein FF098_003670 [Parvularcula flava]|uniref:Uncharacterized protein n=1 Tax=Aquisalinus luteolus TaxID=1566827 RepID=A0ABX0HK23_9PROT|nr:hypothetical protein [Aquisalinus luteolus]NHK27002.1 hypothetical protein [Aquisalinus luteolus]